MRHLVAGRRLNRTSEHLKALLMNLVTALIQHEQIRTTLPKAKEARRVAEKLITLAKDNALHRRRLVGRTIRDPEALRKLFDTLGPRFLRRPGGYTRVVKLGRRLGDAAPMAVLEFVERSPKEETTEGAEAKPAEAKAAAKAAKTPKAAKPKGTVPKKAKAEGQPTPGKESGVQKSSAKGGGTGAKKGGAQRGK